MKKFVLAAAMALLASSVSALDVQGVQLEDTVKVAGVELKITDDESMMRLDYRF